MYTIETRLHRKQNQTIKYINIIIIFFLNYKSPPAVYEFSAAHGYKILYLEYIDYIDYII